MSVKLLTVYFVFLSFMAMTASAKSAAGAAMIPAAPTIAAKSYILMDANSGEIIAQNNADVVLEPASLTKIMTSYVADFEVSKGRINVNDVVTISKNAWAKNFQGSSLMFLEVGKKVKVLDLMKGVIISSGNDAAVALAEYIAGSTSAYVDLMNQQAKLLGMTNTHFANVHGLSNKNHYSTAHDLARLAQAAIHSFPEMYKIYSEKSFTYNGIKQYNRNRLLWRDPSVDGMKTGHTSKAGYCLVASAKRDDMRLIAVVLGTKSEEARAREAQKLFSYGFRYYESKKLYTKSQVTQSIPVWGGKKASVGLAPDKDIYVTLPKASFKDMTAQIQVDQFVLAPIKKGAQLGELIVSVGDKTLLKAPLFATENVEQGGFFQVLWTKIKLFFHKLMA